MRLRIVLAILTKAGSLEREAQASLRANQARTIQAVAPQETALNQATEVAPVVSRVLRVEAAPSMTTETMQEAAAMRIREMVQPRKERPVRTAARRREVAPPIVPGQRMRKRIRIQMIQADMYCRC